MATIKKIAIYDMDGTIVNSLHRYRTIDGKIDLQYWRDNEHRAMQDTLLPLSEQYKKDIADNNTYVFTFDFIFIMIEGRNRDCSCRFHNDGFIVI